MREPQPGDWPTGTMNNPVNNPANNPANDSTDTPIYHTKDGEK